MGCTNICVLAPKPCVKDPTLSDEIVGRVTHLSACGRERVPKIFNSVVLKPVANVCMLDNGRN